MGLEALPVKASEAPSRSDRLGLGLPPVPRGQAGSGHAAGGGRSADQLTSMPGGGEHGAPREPSSPLVVNPHRPDRVEPRAVKRRPKPYPRLTKLRREAATL